MSQCPACKNEFQVKIVSEDPYRVECPVCGKFRMDYALANNWPQGVRSPWKIIGWLRNHSEEEQPKAFLTPELVKVIESGTPDYSPYQKMMLLLNAISRKSKLPGERLRLSSMLDYPLAWTSTEDEFNYYMKELSERKLIANSASMGGGHTCQITMEGWRAIDQVADSAFSDIAFVAMAFSEDMRPVWEEGIVPAVEKAGYKPIRVDLDPHDQHIVMKIIGDIRKARFVIADLTHHRNGVYFEAGFAKGLDKSVILTIRDDEEQVKNTHFDLQQFNQIRWKTPEQLSEALFDYISAIVGVRKTVDIA